MKHLIKFNKINESLSEEDRQMLNKGAMEFVRVDFTGGGDGVYALYIDGELYKYGDEYHDDIRTWIKAFIEGVKYTGQKVEYKKKVCKDEDMIDDISGCANIPPKKLEDVK